MTTSSSSLLRLRDHEVSVSPAEVFCVSFLFGFILVAGLTVMGEVLKDLQVESLISCLESNVKPPFLLYRNVSYH